MTEAAQGVAKGGLGNQAPRNKPASFRFLISSFRFLPRWLFVSETVEGSEAPDEVHGVYADHRTVAKKFRERAQGDAVIRIVEGRDQDSGV